MKRALVAVICAAAAVAGCGKSVIKADGAAKSVVQIVSKQTGFTPTDVKCPSGVDAKAGKTFDCHFTGPENKRYVANMRVTAVKGSRVNFYVQTHPG